MLAPPDVRTVHSRIPVRRAGRACALSVVHGVRVPVGDIRRLSGHPERLASAAYPVDVADQRHLGHRGGRFDHHCRRAEKHLQHDSRDCRRRRIGDQHRQRLLDHRPHAEDVPRTAAEVMSAAAHLTQASYLAAAALFILSLRWLSDPRTARRGVAAGVAGMAAAVGGTLLHPDIVNYTWIIVAVVIGTAIGVPLSKVPLTAVPQRTALSHAFGGLAAGLVGTAKYFLWLQDGELSTFRMAAIGIEIILGYLTFTG